MSAEIQTTAATGFTLYAVVRATSGQAWNNAGGVFESYTSGDWASYALALAEQSGSAWYSCNFPAAITTPGRYSIDLRQQAGASPAPSDTPIGGGVLVWNGAQEVTLDLTQPIPSTNTQGSVGDALLAAEVQGFGRWVLSPSGNTLTVYRRDGSTVARIFNLDNSAAPTQRS